MRLCVLCGSRHRRPHTRAHRPLRGRCPKLCSRCALGERGIIARDPEIHRRASGELSRSDKASPCRDGWKKYPRLCSAGTDSSPLPKSARVFWIGMEAGPELAALAAEVDAKLTPLGIAKEERKFSPHLTLARSSGASGAPGRRKEDHPRRTFEHLQEKLSAFPAPDFGSMTAREFFLYQSRLSPKGSTYTKLARFDLA